MANNSDDSPPVPPQEVMEDSSEPDVILSDRDADNDATATGVCTVELSEIDAEWTPYFRYKQAYQDQIDAIDTFLDLLADNGYYLFEGACGTGKTLAAVTTGIHAIRDRDHLTETRLDQLDRDEFPSYEQLLVSTPLKQQLTQFVEEMRGVNRSLDGDHDAVLTTVLRGRRDMMPYAYAEDLSLFERSSFNREIDDLRQTARKIIEFGSDVPLDWPTNMDPPAFSKCDYNWDNPSAEAEEYEDNYRYDPFRAAAVSQIVSRLPETQTEGYLTVDGVKTPYPSYVPRTTDIVNDVGEGRINKGSIGSEYLGPFDPFYVGFFADEHGPEFGFEEATAGVFGKDDLIEAAASRGVCPHESMAYFAKQSEVALGNYNHLFDPQTRMFTQEKIGFLDDETIVVLDEAHQIEDRVRDMLSAEVDIYTLDRAISDVEIIRHYAAGQMGRTPTPDLIGKQKEVVQEMVQEALGNAGGRSVTTDDLKDFEELLRYTKQRLSEYGAEAIDQRYDSIHWRDAVDRWGPDEEQYPLTDPEDPTDHPDEFLVDAKEDAGITERTFEIGYAVMLSVDIAYSVLENASIHDRTPQGVAVGDFFSRWVDEHPVEYFRQVVLDPQLKDDIPDSYPHWVEAWTPKLQLYNCVPRDELRGVFAELGGGVLMSATIQPEEVLAEAVGIDDVPYPAEDGDDDEENDSSSDDESSEEDDDNEDDSTQGPAVPVRPERNDALDESQVRPSTFEQYPLRYPEENRFSAIVDLPKFIKKNRGGPTQFADEMTSARREYATTLREIAASPGNVLIAMPNYREAKWIHDYLKDDIDKRFHLDKSSSSLETDETLEAFFEPGEAVICTSCRGTITEGVDYDGAKLHCCAAVGIPLPPIYSERIQAVRTAYDERMEYGSGFETALTVPSVRKVRQAFGRVIRGDDEVGTRLLLDKRYASTGWSGVNGYLSDQEQSEFNRVQPQSITSRLDSFWSSVDVDPAERAESASPTSFTEGNDNSVTIATSGSEDTSSDPVKDEDTGTRTDSGSGETERIYFGKEANLSGWIQLDAQATEEEIIPLIEGHIVEDETAGKTIKLNFSKGLSLSGWTDVKARVVCDEIEPLAREYMIK